MPKNWERCAQDDEIYRSERDYQSAAYQLVTEQVLYETDLRQRTAYHVINRHRGAFKEAVALLGLELFFNDDYRYCAAVPREVRMTPLSVQDTLLVLVMRLMFHDRAVRGELDMGRAIVSIEDLLTTYKGKTGRELPSRAGELRAAIDGLRRCGLARAIDAEEGSEQPFDIAILPAIAELVNEAAASRLTGFLDASTATAEEARPEEQT